ncbi:5' nucleotidase, NT5C type [Brassicibacter mesophilus]|uniref:5' nucleotidase, NT5C type n=1 Tax=Brassicibacter mesophilus TaxID=745119 RepID=UPI003D1DDA5A
MSLLNVCIDIDGTITEPYYWLEKANSYFNTSIEPKNVTKYEIHEVLDIPRQEYLDFYNQYGEELHSKAKIRDDVQKILNEIAKYHNTYYVTAREKRMEHVTIKWIKENELPDSQLFLLGSHYKVEKAKELNCNIFIEDRYENAIQLALADFKVLLIDCEYNRYPLIDGITRVFNWKEIYKKITNYSYKKSGEVQEIA